MESISIFDIFKIGVGPSSSHTLGPWKAALLFRQTISDREVATIQIQLFGSLSKTGVGHGTDIAVMLGLEGFDPETIDTQDIPFHISRIRSEQQLNWFQKTIPFAPQQAIIFEDFALPFHPNALTFTAQFTDGTLLKKTYYSTGGGFLSFGVKSHLDTDPNAVKLPYPIQNGADLLAHTERANCAISTLVLANERAFRSNEEITAGIDRILWNFIETVYKGCSSTEETLPGGLNVKRRAKKLCDKLLDGQTYQHRAEWEALIRNCNQDFSSINKWISCFALAVNEENAALGRVVTSPTNGAAGVIPAVLLYYRFFCQPVTMVTDEHRFLLTAGEIGCIFKKGATISAAEGGCQAEIGVSSAMAAGALTEVLGGSPRQVLMAAEIAMEHHLGLTCDPIGGLVQIPCIERNAIGAMKAITAAHLAIESDPEHARVHLDIVVKTMWQTAKDMHVKYKETAEGGLAFNLPVIIPNC